MMRVRLLPGYYLFLIALFLALWANQSPLVSQSELPPLPGHLIPNANTATETARSAPFIPAELSNAGVHIVGTSTSCSTASHMMTSATLSNGQQQLVIFDPAKLSVAVYHIEPGRGDIQLRSVRKIDADFALEEFNLSEPTPSTIRRNAKFSNR